MGIETIDINGIATKLNKDKTESRPGGGMIGIVPMLKDNNPTYVAIVVERLDLAKIYNNLPSDVFNQIGTGGARPCEGHNTLFNDIMINNNRVMANVKALMLTEDNKNGFVCENQDLATAYCYTDAKPDAVQGDYTYQTAMFVFDPMTEAELQKALLEVMANTPDAYRKKVGYTPIDKLAVNSADGKAQFPIFYPNPNGEFVDDGRLYSTGINNDPVAALLRNENVMAKFAAIAMSKVATFMGTLQKIVTPSLDNNNNDSVNKNNNTTTPLSSVKFK